MKKMLLLALPVFSFYSELSHASCQADGSQLMASVCTTAANWCPRGYAFANGALLPISTNSALFSLIGTQFGGDGRTTFALPDLRGRTAVGMGTGVGLTPVVWGQQRGREDVTLTAANLPAAKVTFSNMTVAGTITVDGAVGQGAGDAQQGLTSGSLAGTALYGRDSVNLYSSSDDSVGAVANLTAGGTATLQGGGKEVSLLPPQLGMTYCIATSGIYPSRS